MVIRNCKGCAKDIDIMIGHTDGEKDYHASDWDNYPNPIKDNKYILSKIELGKRTVATPEITGQFLNILKSLKNIYQWAMTR